MTELLQADTAGIDRAAELLRAGELVAFGTETVYGLGGDATSADAVAGIFAAKGRPHFNPLISHYASAQAAFRHVRGSALAQAVADAFWPGPLTLVLPKLPACPVALLATAGLETMAVRVPGHPVASALLTVVDRPVSAPSANRSGKVSPTSAQHVLGEMLGQVAAVLDCGPCVVGLESTVLDLSGAEPRLLRPGGVSVEELEQVIGPLARGVDAGTVRSPGMLASHYAPALPVRLDAESVAMDEVQLAFGPPLPGSAAVFQLSEVCDLRQAAGRLFEGLRWLDAEGVRLQARGIAAMPIPGQGLGLAINDRLSRAAAPRR
jgi:L-threonylcarbamoyladenylate synthase